MHKVEAIEGLRGWLAWTVAFGHIGTACGFAAYDGSMSWLPKAGSISVQVFIVISGFVICNAILERKESWPRYIVRRAFRIFPAYWVAYALALAIFPAALAALALHPAIGDPAFSYDDAMRGWAAAMDEHPSALLFLHTLLLHGVVPDSVWPGGVEAVLPPAWSLSLEWQFYLIAPMLVWLLSSSRWRLPTALAMIAGAIAYKRGIFGVYGDPSVFPAAAHMFLVGIASRLAFSDLRRIPVAPVVVVSTLAFGLLFKDVLWLAIWADLLAFLSSENHWQETGEVVLPAVLRQMLVSPIALYLGARSYSVYLLHLPIIQLVILVACTTFPAITRAQLSMVVLAVAPPLILGASDLLYRLVERPMNGLGGRIARVGAGARPHPDGPGGLATPMGGGIAASLPIAEASVSRYSPRKEPQ